MAVTGVRRYEVQRYDYKGYGYPSIGSMFQGLRTSTVYEQTVRGRGATLSVVMIRQVGEVSHEQGDEAVAAFNTSGKGTRTDPSSGRYAWSVGKYRQTD